MIIATLVYALVFGSLVALAAAAADVVLRLGNRAARGIWLAALGVTVVGTALAPARAAHRPMVAVAGAAPAVPASHSMSLPDRIARSVEIVRQAGTSIVNGALAWMPGSRAARLDRWLAAAWIVASIAAIAMLLAVHQHFRTARRAWPVITLDDTRVRLAPHTGPAVLGLAAPEIVVPAWFVARSRAEQHVALDHEREHVRTRDPLVLAAGFGAAALMPWNPAVWWMLARLRLAVELDCDARVLRRGVTARSYGALLIDLAGRSAAGAGIPVLGLTLTHLERRLIAMTPHRRPFSSARGSLLAAAAVVALVVACNTPVPTAPERAQASRAKTLAAPLPDTLVLRLDGLMKMAVATESLHVNFRPDHMKIKSDAGDSVRSRVHYVITSFRADGQQEQQKHSVVEPDTPKLFDGLVVIDGMISNNESLTQLSPQRIDRIDVLKHSAALHSFADPRAANGVIMVTTKKP